VNLETSVHLVDLRTQSRKGFVSAKDTGVSTTSQSVEQRVQEDDLLVTERRRKSLLHVASVSNEDPRFIGGENERRYEARILKY
jgi:hypothetical protein